MCVKILNQVFNYSNLDLTRSYKAILTRMAWYAAADGTNVYPSIQTLSLQTGYCTRTIDRALKYLRDNQFISLTNERPGLSNMYTININKLVAGGYDIVSQGVRHSVVQKTNYIYNDHDHKQNDLLNKPAKQKELTTNASAIQPPKTSNPNKATTDKQKPEYEHHSKPDRELSNDEMATLTKLEDMGIYSHIASRWIATYPVHELNNKIETAKHYANNPGKYMHKLINQQTKEPQLRHIIPSYNSNNNVIGKTKQPENIINKLDNVMRSNQHAAKLGIQAMRQALRM